MVLLEVSLLQKKMVAGPLGTPETSKSKEKNNVSFAGDLVEIIDSDYSDDSANDYDVETSSQPDRVTTADESPRRASVRLAQRA